MPIESSGPSIMRVDHDPAHVDFRGRLGDALPSAHEEGAAQTLAFMTVIDRPFSNACCPELRPGRASAFARR